MPHVWHLSVISESGRSNLFKNYIKSEDVVVKCLLYPMSLMAENTGILFSCSSSGFTGKNLENMKCGDTAFHFFICGPVWMLLKI